MEWSESKRTKVDIEQWKMREIDKKKYEYRLSER